MQWFYKLFVSEKEVVNNLPLFPSRKLDREALNKLIKFIRKFLFFKKVKNLPIYKKIKKLFEGN